MRIAVAILSLVFLAVFAVGGVMAQGIIRTTGLDAMQVALDKETPVIHYYELSTGERLMVETMKPKPVIRFCDIKEGKNHDSGEDGARVDYDCRYTTGSATYTAKLFWKEQHAADFSLMYTVSGNQLNITCQLTREVTGFQFLSVELPPVLSVEAGQDAKLVIPTYSGRMVDVERSDQKVHQIHPNWFNPIRSAMVINKDILGILTMSSLDDQFFSEVSDKDRKTGDLWVKFVRRAEAPTPDYQFLAQTASTVTVTILGKQGKNPPTWMDGARVIKNGIKSSTNPLYTNSYIYKIFCDSPGSENYTTFADCLKMIKQINALTGGAKQIVYLVGWQYSGHDTGYPDVFKVNERLGGEEGLRSLIEQAREYNAIVSFHDNYDDAYNDSPGWDDSIIAQNSNGELTKGGVWAGGQAFIISPYKYALGKGTERIKKTTEKYPLKDTYHIDVLTADPVRYDYNPKNPAGAMKNLEGKLRIVEQFKRYGLDVTSEGLTSCFVGKVSHFWHMQRENTQVFSSEEIIPFVPFVLHTKASAGGTIKNDEDCLKALLYGITVSDDLNKNTPLDKICDYYYLSVIPWMKLANRDMTAYTKSGDTERIDYNKDTSVEINYKKNIYKVSVDGSTIGQNFTATIPLDKKTIAVYSREGGSISFSAPKDWNVKEVKAYSLNADGTKTDETIVVEGKTLSLTTKPHVPYRVVVP